MIPKMDAATKLSRSRAVTEIIEKINTALGVDVQTYEARGRGKQNEAIKYGRIYLVRWMRSRNYPNSYIAAVLKRSIPTITGIDRNADEALYAKYRTLIKGIE